MLLVSRLLSVPVIRILLVLVQICVVLQAILTVLSERPSTFAIMLALCVVALCYYGLKLGRGPDGVVGVCELAVRSLQPKKPSWSPSIRRIELDKTCTAVQRVLAQRTYRTGPPEQIWRQELKECSEYLVSRFGELGLEPPTTLEQDVVWADRSASGSQNYIRSLAWALTRIIERESEKGGC